MRHYFNRDRKKTPICGCEGKRKKEKRKEKPAAIVYTEDIVLRPWGY